MCIEADDGSAASHPLFAKAEEGVAGGVSLHTLQMERTNTKSFELSKHQERFQSSTRCRISTGAISCHVSYKSDNIFREKALHCS